MIEIGLLFEKECQAENNAELKTGSVWLYTIGIWVLRLKR
jgi:hypothetical protein